MSAEQDREPALSQASLPAGAVFLSYASEDATAAERIATALRSAGIQVWFDKSELRGGDAWDRQIRQQIHDCRLFIAVISAHSEERDEGYFRREWRLAVERVGDMAERRAFLVPVVIDGTLERGASVPEKFRELQWTRLPGGETPPAFVERIKRLLSPDPPTTARSPADAASGSSPITVAQGRPSPWRHALPVAVAVLVVAALSYLLISKPWISKPAAVLATSNATSSPGASPAAFNPPPHSIAVLPFVNMSGDKEQEYFSDGLSEELLNDLARINELQVAARTSAFSFKGKDTDIGTVGRKLNVGAVLEGSVRRSGHTVRITAQLINAVTGFHIWSDTYDRDLGDILKLQTEIATAVASALKLTLLRDAAEKIEVGGTRNPAAFDAYLRGMKGFFTVHDPRTEDLAVIAAFTDAIRLDPNYARAFAGRSTALAQYGGEFIATGATGREYSGKAMADARKAISLAPELAEGHLALAILLAGSLDFAGASQEYERALAIAPGSARMLRNAGDFAVLMGRTDFGIAAVDRALALDPLNLIVHIYRAGALYEAHRYDEAALAYQECISTVPECRSEAHAFLGLVYYALGNFQEARLSCEAEADSVFSYTCLAMVYHRLGRLPDSEAMLGKLTDRYGEVAAYGYAEIYAQWGNTSQALEWLETALRLRDSGLMYLKTDPLLDLLRNEPRFQAIEKALKFPD